jgi:hypothetical protein
MELARSEILKLVTGAIAQTGPSHQARLPRLDPWRKPSLSTPFLFLISDLSSPFLKSFIRSGRCSPRRPLSRKPGPSVYDPSPPT